MTHRPAHPVAPPAAPQRPGTAVHGAARTAAVPVPAPALLEQALAWDRCTAWPTHRIRRFWLMQGR